MTVRCDFEQCQKTGLVQGVIVYPDGEREVVAALSGTLAMQPGIRDKFVVIVNEALSKFFDDAPVRLAPDRN